MRTFFFNGDSNVAGAELNDPQKESMAAIISSRFDCTFMNRSLSGASNDYIYDTTLKYLAANPHPDFVGIGWTEHGREQWYLNGKMHEVNNLGIGPGIPDEYRRRYEFWQSNLRYNSDYHTVMGFYWHNKIYNLHMMLKEKEIPHLFFNTFFAFHIPEEQQLNWHGNFYHPYSQENSYVDWCQTKGYNEITPGWFHFNADAQRTWAGELIKTIEQNNIL